MGLLDWLIGEGKKEEESKVSGKILAKPFNISLSFTPLRLEANRSNSISLNINVKNLTSEPQLVSVDVLLPQNAVLGFEQSCINKSIEKRLGEIRAGESASVSIPIWGSSQTKPGEYEVAVTAYAHYIGYDKVLTYTKTKTKFRAV
ncbi:MAG: hypothetical protein QW590_02245 [Candidatus Bilamarchaeaceae archaeon]